MRVRRFEYETITGQELYDRLKAIDMAPDTFAWLTGTTPSRMAECRRGEREVAYVLLLILEMFEDHAENVIVARRVAAECIKSDKERPDLGEYPFKRIDANA